MNREKRKQRLQLKPYLDKLETRRLMSVGDTNSRFTHVLVQAKAGFESELARGDLDAFALSLVEHPGMAADLRLGALSQALRQHARYAQRHGWGASLVSELTAHPRYAAAHHLMAALNAPPPPTATTVTTPPAQTVVTTTQSVSQSLETVTPTSPVSVGPVAPSPVIQDPLSISVGCTLDVTLPSLGLGSSGVTYTITPQPLPADMTFNRGTGELVFAPAPGQAGVSSFSVAVSDGSRSGTIVLPITVTNPVLTSTEVSGQVVDENGNPLAGMPVTIGAASTVTDSSGDFTLVGVPANPGPISAGGAVGTAQGRQNLLAPVAQLLGHDLYAGANNAIPSPLILPKINWSTAASFSQTVPTAAVNATNPAMPGFSIQLPASAAGAAPATGTLRVAELSAALSAQHMSQGASTGMLLYNIVGSGLSGPVQLTMPNPAGYKPGSVLYLMTVNPTTGGHDVAGQMMVSSDGKTMTSTGPIKLFGTGGSSPAVPAPIGSGGSGSNNFSGCLFDVPQDPNGNPTSFCDGCQQLAGSLNSNAGLVSGEYFLDHQLVTYQSQGQSIGVDLQYSSVQADPLPVVQYQFTTPLAGDSSSIASITAQISLAGVIQGASVTFNTPTGLSDGETYDLPLQVNASALPTGVYTYTMTVTENFGSGTGEISMVTTALGSVNVVNAASDPLGAGWSAAGLQKIAQLATNGPVLVTAGQQGTEAFQPAYSEGQTSIQDLALATSTSATKIMANDGAGNFSASVTAADTVVGNASGDLNNDGKPDLAVVTSSTLAIELNNGSGTFTAGSSYVLPSGYQAKGVAVGNFTGHTNSTLDIAVLLVSTTTNAYSVAVYTGAGTGTFPAPVVSAAGNGVSSGAQPDSIATADFSGDGKTDLVFTTDNSLVDEMLATSGGSMSAATSLPLPTGHLAIGVTTVDYNANGKTDLVVEVKNTNLEEGGAPFVSVDLLTNGGSGTFSDTSTYQTVGQPDYDTLGLVAGAFQGPSMGLEVAVPVTNGGGFNSYLDIVPLSTSGNWGAGVIHYVGEYILPPNTVTSTQAGNIVTADLNGAGKPSIALVNSGTGQIQVLLADAASNQFLPVETITASSSSSAIGMLAVAPFMGHAATITYQGPTSDPSTLVHNANGTWTRTYADGTVIQFNSSGQETSEADRNGNTYHFGYVASGTATGALATITDPVGLVTTLAYNSSGFVSTVTDPANRLTTFTVDSHDNLTQIVDPDGAITTYGYATPANHEATSETNPNGKTATAHYNSFGQLTSETLFDGTSTTRIDSALSNGLLAPGGNGSLSTAIQGSVTDPDGHTTTFTFNWMSHPTGEMQANSGSTTTTFSKLGFVATVTDPLSRTITYTTDSAGDITTITEPNPRGSTGGPLPLGIPGSGATETITYDQFGVPTSITDFNGNTTTFTLDSHGNVLEEMQPGGVDQEWTYNAAGQVLTYTDANGHTTSDTYNSLGRLTSILEPGSGSPTIGYGYDSAGDVTSVTDEMGDTVTITYDKMGRELTEQNPVQAAAGKNTAFTYDHNGNLLTETDANGHTTTYSYNARNEKVTMTDPMGRTTSYGYDTAGNLTTVTDPMNNITTYSYNQLNELLTVTSPLHETTTYGYDLDGEETSVTDGKNNTTQFTYDALGRVQNAVLPPIGGSLATYTYGYDLDGDLLTSTDPNSHTTSYAYNALNEETSVTNADGDKIGYTYDGDGDVLTVTDGLSHTTSNTYNVRGEVLTEVQPAGGGTTTYTYDLAGRMTSLTDPDNNTSTYTYNKANEVATEKSPTGGLTTITYDLVGNPLSVTDPDGHTISYVYDADNEVKTETWMNPSGGSALNVITYTYNADGDVTQIQDANSKYAYSFNADNEETSQSDLGTTGVPTVTLTYAYDADGDRTSMDDSSGGLVSYTYDARDELTNETLSGTGIAAEAVKNAYDQAGNMTGQTRYSNLAETTIVAATSYTYDNANQMTGITDKNSGGTTLVSYGYTYNAASLVSQETRTWASGASTDTLTYGYTNNDQLTSVTHTNTLLANESFAYDANGNETGTGYTTTTGNEQTASPGYTYTYDANGNMITMKQTSTGNVWTYSYDFRNRMTGAVEKTSGGTVLAQVTYTYDALDNRIGRDENGTQTWTLYDGSDPVMDFSSTGSLQMRYLNGPTGAIVDMILARESAGGTVAWYLPDRLGTIRDLINNSGGIIDHVNYSAFGTVLGESSPASGDRLIGFAGMERDTATGLNLAVNRVENPGTGRWDSRDPLQFAAGDADLYRYSNNSPAEFDDPSGLGWGDFGTGLLVGAGTVIGVGIAIGVGTAISPIVGAGVVVTAVGVGAYGLGNLGYELLTGNDASTLQPLTPGDWHYRGGTVVGGVAAGGVLGPKIPGIGKLPWKRPGRLRPPATCRAANPPVNTGSPFPSNPQPGQTLPGIDPNTLQGGRQNVVWGKIRYYLDRPWPWPPITVTPEGVINNGNSRACAGVLTGKPVDVNIVPGPLTPYGPIPDVPIVDHN
jgi:RHS repeat-associated protein